MPQYFDSTVAVSAIFPGSTNHADASARLKADGVDYAGVIKAMADKNLSGLIIYYDALHAAGARKIEKRTKIRMPPYRAGVLSRFMAA